MVTELLQKYIWLVQTILKAGTDGLSHEEIACRWENRFDSPYPRRTFNNHRAAVEEVFGIHIDCNRSTNRYFIKDDVSDENVENAWLINTFTVNNMLALGKERLSGRVSVEDVPSGHIHLTAVMDAMVQGYKVGITYLKYTSSQPDVLTVRPYAVKEFEKRWYIVGYCEQRQGMRVYGLDRVLKLDVLVERFRMPEGFDVDAEFATSFGIYLPEGPGRTILFKAGLTEARYLRDLPLHHSQEEVSCDGDSVTFSIFVCPNRALVMEFCRRGARVEVLSPADVREAVAKELAAAADIYGTD
ncbi:MAG: helix-turn-helix transcriptional regulator [Candidatus Cryptobacteroides sp.]